MPCHTISLSSDASIALACANAALAFPIPIRTIIRAPPVSLSFQGPSRLWRIKASIDWIGSYDSRQYIAAAVGSWRHSASCSVAGAEKAWRGKWKRKRRQPRVGR